MLRHDLQFVNAGRGCNRRPYIRGILFSKRLFCFVQAKTLCRYGCMYFYDMTCNLLMLVEDAIGDHT